MPGSGFPQISFMKEQKHRGNVFFIRHGESTSNERNIFAGVLDVDLTDFGQAQARRAGLDLRNKTAQIDAVFLSYMRRAQQTCDIALEASGVLRAPSVPTQIDHRLAERSFGIFANLNYNLLRSSLGYRHFESMLHSASEAPPAGEPIAEIYDRFRSFYEEQIIPRINRGENVLIVSHQYVLEAAVLYLSGKTPQEYHHLKLPNGKALSREELIQFYSQETSAACLHRKEANDKLAMVGLPLAGLAFLIGSGSKAFLGLPGLPSWLFTLFVLVGLGLSSFYTYLDLDFKRCQERVPKSSQWIGYGSYILRWALGIDLLAINAFNQGRPDHPLILAALFCLVPPALSSPMISVLWGGNLYPAALMSRWLSFILPVGLILLAAFHLVSIHVEGLITYFSILGAGLLLPAFLAQRWRAHGPVASHRHSKEWRFLAVIGMIIAAVIAGYQFAPRTLVQDLITRMNPERTAMCIQQMVLAAAVLLGIRAFGLATTLLPDRFLQRQEAKDIYILISTPNFFLWSSLLAGCSMLDLRYLLFWLGAGFFCLPAIEQGILVTIFRRNLLKEALRSTRMDLFEIRHMFAQLDVDGNGRLDRTELAQFILIVEKRTLGQNPDRNDQDYLIDYLLMTMDLNRSGSIELPEWERYLSANGLVVNLNPPKTPAVAAHLPGRRGKRSTQPEVSYAI